MTVSLLRRKRAIRPDAEIHVIIGQVLCHLVTDGWEMVESPERNLDLTLRLLADAANTDMDPTRS